MGLILVFENTLNDVKDIIMNFIKKEALYGNGSDAFEIMYQNNVKMNRTHDVEDEDKENEKKKHGNENKSIECKHEEELKERIAKTFVPMMEMNKLSVNSTNETSEIKLEEGEETINNEDISESDLNIENSKDTENNNTTDILLQISQQLIHINSLN